MPVSESGTGFTSRQFEALYRLAKLVRASLDLDETLSAIVDAARELAGADLSAILLLEERDQLVLRVVRGAVAAAVGENVPASAGIAGRALRDRRAVVVADMQSEPGRARPGLDERSGIRAYIAAPLIWEDQPLGVVTVGATTPHAFDASATAVVRELAEHAAAAVAHARSHTNEQVQRARAEALNRELADCTQQLEGLRHQLVQNEKLTAIGQLAHGIAHELNTPLGVVVSNLTVLDEYGSGLAEFARVVQSVATDLEQHGLAAPSALKLTAAAQAADLEYVLDDLPRLTAESSASAGRMATIVRSVATFARQTPEAFSSVNVEEALETAMTLAWNELKHHARVVREFASVPPVAGQVSELAQVFVHLLLNAAQALQDREGVITVGTQREGGEVLVTIHDNGCGIPPENLPRVFDPFFTTHGPGHGTGMGLAVCHGIVTRSGGSIDLESTPGGGTIVMVRLPLAHRAQLELE